jgi:hypothetical protein
MGRVEFSISNLGPLGDIRIRAGQVSSFVTDLFIAFINIFDTMNIENVRILFCPMQTFPAISLITATKNFISTAVH